MAAEKEDVLTAGSIAKELGISEAKVKKAIKDLAIDPKMKKGVCCYYSRDALADIKAAVK